MFYNESILKYIEVDIPGSPAPGQAIQNLIKTIRTGCFLHQVVMRHEVVTLKIGCLLFLGWCPFGKTFSDPLVMF